MPIKPISWSAKFSSNYLWKIIIHILATPMASIGGGQQPNKEEKLLLSLHKERSWSSPYVYLFQEFWCLSTVILVTSLPKSGTTWLKSLIFTIVNQQYFSPTHYLLPIPMTLWLPLNIHCLMMICKCTQIYNISTSLSHDFIVLTFHSLRYPTQSLSLFVEIHLTLLFHHGLSLVVLSNHLYLH